MVNEKEKLNMTKDSILNIKNYYNSDIRSMINYMQNNINNNKIETITNKIYEKIYIIHTNKSLCDFCDFIYNTSNNLLIDYRIIIKKYIGFLIQYKNDIVNNKNIRADLQFIYNNVIINNTIKYLFYLLSNK